jgi:hypothetical protein
MRMDRKLNSDLDVQRITSCNSVPQPADFGEDRLRIYPLKSAGSRHTQVHTNARN